MGQSVPGPEHWRHGYSIDLVQHAPLRAHTCRQVHSCVTRLAWLAGLWCVLFRAGGSDKKERRHISDKPGGQPHSTTH